MKGFLDKLQNNKPNKKNHEFKNPFASKKNQDRGGGKSLGGSKPGKILSFTITDPGPIGVILENTREGSAIIASVAHGSQAQTVGLMRGDVICFQEEQDDATGNGNGNGKNEIPYKIFLEMVKSSTLRPLNFNIRRIESSASAAAASTSTSGHSSHGSTTSNSNSGFGMNGIRADEQARRQAVIAAAEARDKQNKFKKKPIRKGGLASELTTEQKKKIQQQRDQLEIKNATQLSNAPLTNESKKAVEAAKQNEAMHAQQLGYNPYETMKGTGQQGSAAVTSLHHGSLDAGPGGSGSGNGSASGSGSKGGSAASKATNVVNSQKKKPSSSSLQMQSIDPTFDEAFTTLITTNDNKETIIKSLRIMRKLIINATTVATGEREGDQQQQQQQSQEKKRVRISNPNKHIEAAIHHTEGALDLMMSVGFIIMEMDHDEDSETYLMYQYQTETEFGNEEFPKWLNKALAQMEEYENNL